MADLTEQWQKGELPEGWYYIEGNRAEGIYAYTAEYLNNMYRPRNGERIITKVPSYEEWKKAYECVVSENEEITTLKELLKRARGLMNYTKDWACSDATEEMIAEIDQALGEDK
jgi:hypothetical protein